MIVKSNQHFNLESKLIDACLVSSVLGCFISIAFVGLSHVLIIITLIYILYKKNKINYSILREPSIVALIFLVTIIIASLVVNYDMVSSFSNSILKIKYFILPIIIIFVLKSIKLKYLFYIATILAIISSIYGTLELLATDITRNRGFMGSTMSFSHNLSLFNVLFIGIGIYKLKTMKRFHLIFFIVITLFFIYTIYATKTRGAWFSLAVGAYLIFYMQVNKRKLIISLTFISIITLGILYQMDKLNIISKMRPGSDEVRLKLAESAIVITEGKPLLGVGFRQFESAFNTYADEETLNIVRDGFRGHAHNLYLEYSATTGILGLVAFLSWMFLWGKKLWNDKNTRMISIPAFACILTSGLTHYNFGDGENITLIMLLFVISHVYTRGNYIDNDFIQKENYN
jgi:O-antigen ligase